MRSSAKFDDGLPREATRETFSQAFTSSCFSLFSNTDSVKRIYAVRILLLTVLLAATAVCSTMAWYILDSAQHELFHKQFRSVTNSAETAVTEAFTRMDLGLQEMSYTIGYIFPKADEWPNVAWSGFYRTSEILSRISALNSIVFMPLVWPEKAPSYESFIADFLLNDPNVPQPVWAHVPYVQVGEIWAYDSTTGFPRHDTTGITPLSDRALMTPVAQFLFSEALGPQLLSFNGHADSRFAGMIDTVMDCVANNDYLDATQYCGALSVPVTLPYAEYNNPNPEIVDVVALFMQPIIPDQNRTALTGFVGAEMSWTALLSKAFPTFVTGIDCVIVTETLTFTFTIVEGVPVYQGLGDLHESKYSKHVHSSLLVRNTDRIYATATYTLNIYPSDAFVERYTDRLPVWAALAMVAVFVICCGCFVAYDTLLHRESDRRQAVLDTKRRFVRFISHEIRTPLNVVRLGLKLFDVELGNVTSQIGRARPSDLVKILQTATRSWKHLMADIMENSESAVEVLDALLNYDDIEMGTLRLNYSQFSIMEVVAKVTASLLGQATQKDIRLELHGNHPCLQEAYAAAVVAQSNSGVASPTAATTTTTAASTFNSSVGMAGSLKQQASGSGGDLAIGLGGTGTLGRNSGTYSGGSTARRGSNNNVAFSTADPPGGIYGVGGGNTGAWVDSAVSLFGAGEDNKDMSEGPEYGEDGAHRDSKDANPNPHRHLSVDSYAAAALQEESFGKPTGAHMSPAPSKTLLNTVIMGKSGGARGAKNDAILRDNCLVAADLTRVIQVLRNLILDAIKFSPPGSTVRVKGNFFFLLLQKQKESSS
jgi:signal transduction histidine kinase